MYRLIHLMCALMAVPLLVGASDPPFTVLVDYSVFNTPQNEPYAEVYVSVDAAGLTWQQGEAGFVSGAEVTILFSQGDRIVNFDRFDVTSKPISDTSEVNFSILSPRRIALDNGLYEMEIVVKDLNKPEREVKLSGTPVDVDFAGEGVEISDLRLVESVAENADGIGRNGLTWEPYLIPYYPTQRTQLQFYAEVYGLGQEYLNEDVLIAYSILPKEGGQPLTGMRNFLKQKGQDVNVVLGTLNITDLPSGEFRLQVEVRDRSNTLLATASQPVHRSNRLGIKEYGNLAFVDVSNTFVAQYTDEEIAYFVRALRPIASEKEVGAIETLRESEKPELMRQFFFNFWVERDPNEPQKPWSHYHAALRYVDSQFKTFTRNGFETDRGRVYLQYGPPNELHQSGFETNSAPYEIWQYNSIPNGETNVIFVFYEPDIVSNDYKLLHSNATGEIHNDQWKVILYGKDGRNRNTDLENTSTPDQFGTKVADPFEHRR